MHGSHSRLITYISVLQFVPLVLFPWGLTISTVVALVVLALLCAFLGWALMQRKPWAKTLTIFVQGLNVIVRIITFFANVYQPDRGTNLALLITYVLSIVLSVVILSYIDRPEVQLSFES
jgi:hypothetical protein